MTNQNQEILNHCLNDDLLKLRALFQAAGFDIRIVGGAVRDILCGHTPKDVDLCTDAYPDEAIAIYTDNGIRFEPTGIDHGTISVIMNGETYEITSLRYDTETDGRHAKVTFTRLWYEDLARRDLTINAMSMTFDGVLDDPYGGQKDLENGIVQFVGDPELRIQEDYLRILRFFRFAGRFGSQFDKRQMAAIRKHAEGLRKVSRERVWQEVGKMMSHDSAARVYRAMRDANVLVPSDLPKVSDEALERMGTAVSYTKNPATVFSTAFKTADQVAEVGKKLKMRTNDIRLMQYLTTFSSLDDDMMFQRAKFGMVLEGTSREFAVEAALRMGRTLAADRIRDWDMPVFPINGNDLVELGVKPSKEMGSMLMSMKYAWFTSGDYDGKFQERDVVLDIAKTMLETKQ
jgi:tRNA nucleotidyltransferase (CCA-adding enzyme)